MLQYSEGISDEIAISDEKDLNLPVVPMTISVFPMEKADPQFADGAQDEIHSDEKGPQYTGGSQDEFRVDSDEKGEQRYAEAPTDDFRVSNEKGDSTPFESVGGSQDEFRSDEKGPQFADGGNDEFSCREGRPSIRAGTSR